MSLNGSNIKDITRYDIINFLNRKATNKLGDLALG